MFGAYVLADNGNIGDWTVSENGAVCIRMKAEITLVLSYMQKHERVVSFRLNFLLNNTALTEQHLVITPFFCCAFAELKIENFYDT